MSKKIKAILLFEMLGRPKEHLMDSMKKLIETLEKEKVITVISRKFNEPKKIEEKDKEGNIVQTSEEKQMYSTFSEVELETAKIVDLAALCFIFMPSHVEVLEPDNFSMANFELNSILNDILSKMHNYDSIAKVALMNNQAMVQKLKLLEQRMQQGTVQNMPVPSMTFEAKKLDNKSGKKAKKKKR